MEINLRSVLMLICLLPVQARAQQTEKVTHAEPLYYDLVRDLGARKGEKELNIGTEFVNFADYSKNLFLIEYEFAPVNRLGLEVETDVSFFKETSPDTDVPDNKMESIKLSAQYSFLVSSAYKTTLAVGYTQMVEQVGFKSYGKGRLFSGTVYSPFFVAAKRWKDNFNTLLFAYPAIAQDFVSRSITTTWFVHTSMLYTIPQTRHFIGVEFNYERCKSHDELTIRPQLKLKLSKDVAVGIVAGLPVNNSTEGFSSFFRFIYEP